MNSDDIFPTSRSIVLPNQYLAEPIEEDQNSLTDYNSEEDIEGCDFFPTGRSIVLPTNYSSELEPVEQDQKRLTEFNNEEQRVGSDFLPRRSITLPRYTPESIEDDETEPDKIPLANTFDVTSTTLDGIIKHKKRLKQRQKKILRKNRKFATKLNSKAKDIVNNFNNEEQRVGSDFLPRRSITLPRYTSESIEDDETEPDKIPLANTFDVTSTTLDGIIKHKKRLKRRQKKILRKNRKFATKLNSKAKDIVNNFNNEEQRVGSDFLPRRSITLPRYTSESIEDDETEPDKIPLANTFDVTSTTLDGIIKHKKRLKQRQKKILRKNRKFATKLNSNAKDIVNNFIRAETCLQKARKLNNQMGANNIRNQKNNHDTSMEWEESTPIKPRKAPPNTNIGWFEGKYEKNKPPNLDSELAIVLDTNVLLSSLHFIQTVKDKPYSEFRAKFIVPYQVLEELDHLKNNTTHTIRSMAARKANNMLYNAIGKKHPRFIGQPNNRDTNNYEHMTSTRADDFIISCCVQYKNEGYNVVLFTGDKNLTTRALLNGIKSVFKNDLMKMANITKSKKRRKKLRNRNNRNRTSFGRTNSMEDLQNEDYNFMSTTNNTEELQNENDSSVLQDEHTENLSGYIPDNSYSESGTGPYERSDFEEVQTESVNLEPDDNISDLDTGTKKHCKSSTSHETGGRSSFGRTNSVEDLQNQSDSYMSLSENKESPRCVNSDNSNNGNNVKNEEQNSPLMRTFGQPKRVPEYGLTLLDKLKRSLIFFLSSVLKIQLPKMNKENRQINEEMTVVLNDCLCRMQLGWTEVLNQPLLEDDVVCLRVLKNILLKPAEEISWNQTTVEDLMNAAARLAESFLKYDKYVLSATSFTLVLRACRDVEKRLIHEIEQLKVAALEETENTKVAALEETENTEVLLAESAFHICWCELYSQDVPSEYNLYKSKGPEALKEYIDSLSQTYSHVTDMLNGIKGVLKENPKSLTLNNPSVKLLFDTLVGIIPESTPLEIPSTSDSPSEPYFSYDLSVQCILAYCSRHDKRETLTQAKDKWCKLWYTISKCCDEYCGLV